MVECTLFVLTLMPFVYLFGWVLVCLVWIGLVFRFKIIDLVFRIWLVILFVFCFDFDCICLELVYYCIMFRVVLLMFAGYCHGGFDLICLLVVCFWMWRCFVCYVLILWVCLLFVCLKLIIVIVYCCLFVMWLFCVFD